MQGNNGVVTTGKDFAYNSNQGVRLFQPSAPDTDANAREVTYMERLIPETGSLSDGTVLTYKFNVKTQPQVSGAALWVTMIDENTGSLLPSDDVSDNDGTVRFYRICINKQDAWGKNCDEYADVPTGEWISHTWNVLMKFRTKYPEADLPSRIKLQFSTYGGSPAFFYDYDNFGKLFVIVLFPFRFLCSPFFHFQSKAPVVEMTGIPEIVAIRLYAAAAMMPLVKHTKDGATWTQIIVPVAAISSIPIKTLKSIKVTGASMSRSSPKCAWHSNLSAIRHN